MAILTVSRQYGSGGTEIAQAVAGLLGYRYVDKDTILEDLRQHGAQWEHWAEELDEHCPTIWEKYDWSFRGFVALVQSHVLEHAAKGKAVILGRGGNFLLAGIPAAFRIRVEASEEVRIARVMRSKHLDREKARWLVEKTDSERACFIHAIYGKKWDDPAEYDAVFQVAGQEIDDLAGAVKEALAERERRRTPEVQKRLDLMAAAARVKAGIATNSAFFVPVLEIVPEGEGLVVRGVTHTTREHRRLEEETKKLAGDLPIRCELHYRV